MRHLGEFAGLAEAAGKQWKLFPDAPLEVTVMRRSRGATFSAAYVPAGEDAAAIWIRDGSWDAATVLHELAHVAVGADPGPDGTHGERFATGVYTPIPG